MEQIEIRLLAAWGDHAIDTKLEVDEELGKKLIEKGIAEKYDPVQEGLDTAKIKAAQDERDAAVTKRVLAELQDKAGDDNRTTKVISVKDKGDADPLGGYGPEGHSLELKDFEDDKNKYTLWLAAGKFFIDMKNAINGASQRLMRLRQQSDEMQAKAAGDGMIVGDDEHGGYLTPAAISMELMTFGLAAAVVRPRARQVPMSTQLLKLPYLKQENETANVYGGIAIYFDDELAQYTASRPELGMIEMKLKKMTAMAHASEEWEKWSPVTAGGWLLPRFGEAVAWTEDRVFILGKGGAQPLGILNSAGLISQAKESGQTANTIVRQNIDKMFSRLKVTNENNVAWLMNRSCFPQLPALNVTAGTGGSPIFVNNISGKPGQSLWGYPIIYTDFVPVLGDAQDLVLTDFTDYLIADDAAGLAIAQSIHFKFDYGQNTWRLFKFIDGQNIQNTTFTPFKAGATAVETRSSVITLAERA